MKAKQTPTYKLTIHEDKGHGNIKTIEKCSKNSADLLMELNKFEKELLITETEFVQITISKY